MANRHKCTRKTPQLFCAACAFRRKWMPILKGEKCATQLGGTRIMAR